MRRHLLAAALLALLTPDVQASLVTNGSLAGPVGFGSVPTGWSNIPSSDTINESSHGPGSIGTWDPSSDGGTWIASVGTREGFYQDISGLVIGQQYRLDFEQSVATWINGSGGREAYWNVNFGGESFDSDTMTSPIFNTTSFGSWVDQSTIFTATATMQRLQFNAEIVSNENNTGYLGADGISLTAVSTPEPSSCALVGLFGLMAPILRRYRRNAH